MERKSVICSSSQPLTEHVLLNSWNRASLQRRNENGAASVNQFKRLTIEKRASCCCSGTPLWVDNCFVLLKLTSRQHSTEVHDAG
jgi:hypothetical protein